MESRRNGRVGRHRAFAAAAAAALVIAATQVVGSSAGADPKTIRVNARITSQTFGGPSCPSPFGLCAAGQIRGTLNGPFEVVVTNVIPSTTPNVIFATASVVFHDRRGDLFCTEDFAFNPAADQSFGVICQITGGTGRWAGATGYLVGYGFLPPGETQTTGVITGKIVIPD
jgi:hypothetical protein